MSSSADSKTNVSGDLARKPRKDYAIYVITKHGLEIAAKIREALPEADMYVSPKQIANAPADARELSLPMGPTLRATFDEYNCHIHIISVGAVVRMIKDLMVNKKTDPAIVCVDDASRFAICVLSGHVGRGNFFTDRIATAINATPVITTASDARGTLTVDILGRDLGWVLDDMDRNVTRGCAAVVNETRVALVQESGEAEFWPLDKALPPGVEYYTKLDDVNPADFEILLIVSDRDVAASHPAHFENSVLFRAKSLVLGLGCDRDTPFEIIERGVLHHLNAVGLSVKSIKSIASIDKKADEPGLIALSEKYDWPFTVYPAEELDVVPGIENPSEVVKKYVGTRAVAEPACLLAAGAEKLLVAKQAYKEDHDKHNMTLAVARIPFAPRKV
ncbi:MAG: cobalamin biosynthesis protein [bacterium]|nr:cobalamin biosynthesis protein [bacterium]